MLQTWIDRALEIGFSIAVPLDVRTLTPMQMVRDMCAADSCRAYGKNWTCPPLCGSLTECGTRLQSYNTGILLQSVGQMRRAIDSAAIQETEQRHLKLFHQFSDEIRSADHPEALCLGAGGCRVCPTCAYPNPCRFPDRACSSMEGYGLFVTQVCRDNQVPYYHGEKTITFSACILFQTSDSSGCDRG